jgi:tRNA modification GTPase
MFSTSDTIVAIATPPGRGGIGVVRVSGPTARDIGTAVLSAREPLEPRRATFTHVKSSAANQLDQVVATYFERPASYTGEDIVEISAHGSPIVLREIVRAAMQAGARLAEPGEFTFRAFLNGRIDLVQAEAVADLIEAVTPLQARAAYDQLEGTLTQEIAVIDAALFDLMARFEASVDFPEEGYHFVEPGTSAGEIAAIERRVARLLADATRGRLIREGAQVAIVGKPNVGKSSLFNALVGASRAIVTPLPGTTRDFITELTDVAGLRLTLVDTAGERMPGADQADLDEVERAGIERARGARSVADLVLIVLDRSAPLEDMDRLILEQTAALPRVIVVNKVDLPKAWSAEALGGQGRAAVSTCARTREGLDALGETIVRELGGVAGIDRDTAAVTNVRHIDLLERADAALRRARDAVTASGDVLSEEFILADLQDARNAFEEIVGKRTADDLLKHIFGRFCIGK